MVHGKKSSMVLRAGRWLDKKTKASRHCICGRFNLIELACGILVRVIGEDTGELEGVDVNETIVRNKVDARGVEDGVTEKRGGWAGASPPDEEQKNRKQLRESYDGEQHFS